MLKGTDQQNGRRTNAPNESTVVADEIPAKLRSLLNRLESQSSSRHLTARNREQRLVKMREEITKVAKKEARPFCNCKQITAAYGCKPEEFEAEMKLVCPIHGRRKLGVIVPFLGLPYDDDDLRLLELLDRYARSLLEFGV
jgi:hypothetical protein